MKQAFAILGAALLVALGLFLPRLTAAYQDQNLAGDVRRMENAAVSLTLAEEVMELSELDLFQSLDLFSLSSSMVELEEGRYTSAVDAARASSILDLVLDADVYLDDDKILPTEVVPFLLTDGYGRSGIFWRCGWEEHPDEAVWIDDQNRSVVGFCLRCSAFDHPMNSQEAYDLCQEICGFIFPQDVGAAGFWADDDVLLISLSRGEESVVIAVRNIDGFLCFNSDPDSGSGTTDNPISS